MSEAVDRGGPDRGGAASNLARPLPEVLPRHIAFIMDGNGRWAMARGLPRLIGHERGADALRRITRFCRSAGISELTFFALSTENFLRRPFHEIHFLMRLLRRYLASEQRELLDNGIRLKAIGRLDELAGGVLETLRRTEEITAGQRGMILRLALNYGGRQEILDAVGKIVAEARKDAPGAEGSALPGGAQDSPRVAATGGTAFDEREFRRHLYDPEMSDPDLLVRTAGELRLSNFLLWHCSYSEIWVTPSLWPDFDVPELVEALHAYAARERKYGSVVAVEPSGHERKQEPR